jgi:hypothetical protein
MIHLREWPVDGDINFETYHRIFLNGNSVGKE